MTSKVRVSWRGRRRRVNVMEWWNVNSNLLTHTLCSQMAAPAVRLCTRKLVRTSTKGGIKGVLYSRGTAAFHWKCNVLCTEGKYATSCRKLIICGKENIQLRVPFNYFPKYDIKKKSTVFLRSPIFEKASNFFLKVSTLCLSFCCKELLSGWRLDNGGMNWHGQPTVLRERPLSVHSV